MSIGKQIWEEAFETGQDWEAHCARGISTDPPVPLPDESWHQSKAKQISERLQAVLNAIDAIDAQDFDSIYEVAPIGFAEKLQRLIQARDYLRDENLL